jgi:hypothetical protein
MVRFVLAIFSYYVLNTNAILFQPYDDSQVLGNFFISWQNKGTQTDFEINFILDKTAPINSVANIWIAVGLNRNALMVRLVFFVSLSKNSKTRHQLGLRC